MIESQAIVECDWDACRQRTEATVKQRAGQTWVELPRGWGEVAGKHLCPEHSVEQSRVGDYSSMSAARSLMPERSEDLHEAYAVEDLDEAAMGMLREQRRLQDQ